MSTNQMQTNEKFIVGNPVRHGFNECGTLDLNDFAGLVPVNFKGCTFSHYEFLDLNTIDLDTENFANVGIREDFDVNKRIEALEVSFETHGFKTTETPPSRDSDGNWLDGRGRAAAAINNEERWMPVAVYSREDTSLSNTISNGIFGNLIGLPNSPATFGDIVSGGVHLVNSGELEASVAAVDNWLTHVLELHKHFKQENITKMKNSIIEVSTRDESLILRKSTKEWHSWIKRNLELKRAQYVLVNASDKSCDTYMQRVWCESILPAIILGTDPVDIIFYTSVYRPAEARSGLAKSIKKLDHLYDMSFKLVKSQLSSAGLNLEMVLSATGTSLEEAEKPFNIIGACPQIVKSHNFSAGNLVKVDKY